MIGTGHNMALTMPDGNMYTVYHGRMTSAPEKRVVLIDRMEIDSTGILSVTGPTTEPQTIAY